MKRILIPSDFSVNAKKAINFAIEYHGIENCEYFLINTYREPNLGASTVIAITDILKQISESSLKQEKRRLKSLFGHQLKIETISEYGTLIQAAKYQCKKLGLDTVVMGTKGASGLKEVMLGSNAADLIDELNIPVMVVPTSVSDKKPKKVLFPFRFDYLDQGKYVKKLESVLDEDSIITFLHIDKDEFKVDTYKEAIDEILSINNLKSSFEYVLNSNVIAGIEEYLNENQFDLLVLLHKKRSLLDDLFHKSITHNMVFHNNTPMLALTI